MCYVPYCQSNIGITQLAKEFDANYFSKLPPETKVNILKKVLSTNPGKAATELATIELVSREWNHIALTELWKIAAKQFFSPEQIVNARNHLFQQFNREPSWKEIYLSFISRTVKMTSESSPKKSLPLYITTGSNLMFYAENTGSNLMSYLIDADKNISEWERVPGVLIPILVSGWLKPKEKINKIIPINISANYKLKLNCINERIDLGLDSFYVSNPIKCTGFAQMTLI